MRGGQHAYDKSYTKMNSIMCVSTYNGTFKLIEWSQKIKAKETETAREVDSKTIVNSFLLSQMIISH